MINKNNHIQLMNYGLIQENNKNYNNADKNGEIDSSNFLIDNFFFTQVEIIYNEHSFINEKENEKKEDIYGIGVVLYVLVCGTQPFSSKENMNLFKDDFKKNKLMINEYFSKELKNLLNKLLSKDKCEKINNLDEIKKHEFFKDFNWNKLINLQIISPNNLVKIVLKIGIKLDLIKLKSENKEYFLDYNIVTKSQNINFIEKYFENSTKVGNNKEKNKLNKE